MFWVFIVLNVLKPFLKKKSLENCFYSKLSLQLLLGCLSLFYKREDVLLETAPLAPIEVEILLCRGSAQKIGTHSGIKLLIFEIK
jgi:uncharacterized protein YhhL (DUF1145 family)